MDPEATRNLFDDNFQNVLYCMWFVTTILNFVDENHIDTAF